MSDSMLLLIYAAASFVATAVLVGFVRCYAVRNDIIDVPNERSSHTQPTPRGGGLAIAIVLFGAYISVLALGRFNIGEMVGFLGGGILVAFIGWLDDRRDIAAPVRVAVQAVAVAWALFWVKGYPVMSLGFTQIPLGGFGTVLAALAMLWLINLYNFLDGIDGIAAAQGCCAATIGAVLLTGAGAVLWALTASVLAGACAGFLMWNWAPARIFLGDVGSYTIGYTFGMLAIMGENSGDLPALVWVVLLSVFIFDATTTLIKRVLTGQPWYSPHRTHGYQRLVQCGWYHRDVALAVVAINIVVIAPMVWLTVQRPLSLLPVVAITAGIMMFLWAIIQRYYERQRNET